MSVTPPTDEVLRHRHIRAAILQLLERWYAASEGSIAVDWEQLSRAVRVGQIPPSEQAVRVALRDLVADDLVQAAAHSFRPGVRCYQLTSKGADFVRAGYPWDRIDEFTGGQRLGGDA